MPGRPAALLAALLLVLGCGRTPPPPGAGALIAEPEGELSPTPPPPSPPLPAPRVRALALTASGSDGHLPAAAGDGDLTTHWSQYGRGAWLQADLGAVQTLAAVEVAWYRGDRRYNRFTVSVSTDGTTFTSAYRGSSSGRTLLPERYTFRRPLPGRYVRVTVEGNSENDWVSIDELRVDASPASPLRAAPPATRG